MCKLIDNKLVSIIINSQTSNKYLTMMWRCMVCTPQDNLPQSLPELHFLYDLLTCNKSYVYHTNFANSGAMIGGPPSLLQTSRLQYITYASGDLPVQCLKIKHSGFKFYHVPSRHTQIGSPPNPK